MTRKSFLKSILGAVGGISVLSALTKKPVYQCVKLSKEERTAVWESMKKDPKWLESYHKGVQIAKYEAKEGDYTQITAAKQPYKITHIFQDGQVIKSKINLSRRFPGLA